jgi:hypothetical protein
MVLLLVQQELLVVCLELLELDVLECLVLGLALMVLIVPQQEQHFPVLPFAFCVFRQA